MQNIPSNNDNDKKRHSIAHPNSEFILSLSLSPPPQKKKGKENQILEQEK